MATIRELLDSIIGMTADAKDTETVESLLDAADDIQTEIGQVMDKALQISNESDLEEPDSLQLPWHS